jgi:hypothetical protein
LSLGTMQIAKSAGYLRILLWRPLERVCQYLIEQGAFLVHRKNLGKNTGRIDKPQNKKSSSLLFIYIILILSSTRRERGDRRSDKNKQCNELFFFGTYLVTVTNTNRYLILHLYISTPREKQNQAFFRSG